MNTSMSNPVKFRGVAFEFGDDTVIVPALALGRAREKETAVIAAKMPDDIVNARIDAVKSALLMNYSAEETETLVAEFISYNNLNGLYLAAIGFDEDANGKSLGKRVKSAGELAPVDQNT